VVTSLMARLLLTQKEFAESCGVAQQTISAWKAGARQPGRMAQRRLLLMAKGAGLAEELFPADALAHWRQVEARSGYSRRDIDDPVLREINLLLADGPTDLRQEVLAFVRFRVLGA